MCLPSRKRKEIQSPKLYSGVSESAQNIVSGELFCWSQVGQPQGATVLWLFPGPVNNLVIAQSWGRGMEAPT